MPSLREQNTIAVEEAERAEERRVGEALALYSKWAAEERGRKPLVAPTQKRALGSSGRLRPHYIAGSNPDAPDASHIL